MEKPLLGGESSGLRRRGRQPQSGFRGWSDAITHGSAYQKAAALVDLAEDGIGIPEQILEQSDFQSAAKFYFIFLRLDFIWFLGYFALIILNFLEKPLWCTSSAYSCSDRDYFFLGQLPYLTGAESLIFEGITLIVLVVHNFFPLSYEGFQFYWKNTLNQFKVAPAITSCLLGAQSFGCYFRYHHGYIYHDAKVLCLLILVADILMYALYLSPVAFSSLPFRIAPYIRVVLFILNIRELRSTILILAGMLGTYLNIMALTLLFLLFASWVAYVMFEDTQEGKTIFTSYGTTLYQMFILFTTSNNPDVWTPAYKTSRWYCIFFILYVLVGVYFVTNLILAVVYDSFKGQLVKQVSGMDQMRRSMLEKAFKLIDKDNLGFIDKKQCKLLLEQLNNYRSLPKISGEEFDLIFDELDDSRDFKINLDEFNDLCNAIALRFHREDTPSCCQNFPFYSSPLSENLKAFVRSPKFGYTISFILIMNLFAVIVETTLDIENNSAQKVWQVVEFVFGWIYMIEMALKIYSFGFVNYWRDGQNRFDFLITWIIVIGETLTFLAPEGLTFLSNNGEWIRYLLLARMLRLIRLLMHVQRYRAFVATFLTLIPSLMPYLGTIFCVLCIYCSLGIQIFGGLVNSGNPNLEATGLAENDYLLFNFNDYPNGMVTLFNLLVMGNWQVWMQSYEELTGTSWTIIYFISFYLITVLLLLNLVVAFVLEAFFSEMDLESPENDKEQDEEAEEIKHKPRSIGSKSQSQRIDMLLHHMLSAELSETRSSVA